MILNAKQKKCVAALILLTAMSKNEDLKEVAKIFGKHTLNYSNTRNNELLTEMEPEFGELFETYLRKIKTAYLEQSVSSTNSMSFELLNDVNDAVDRAIIQYNGTKEMVYLSSFKITIRSICQHIKG